MRYTVARTFVLVLGLLTALFSLDAAMKAHIGLALLLAIVGLAVGYIVLMLWLAGQVLHGTPRSRRTAAFATDIAAALPLLLLLAALPAVSGGHVAAASRGAVAWLLFVLLWTWLAVHSRGTGRGEVP